jgi:hypothetical protein
MNHFIALMSLLLGLCLAQSVAIDPPERLEQTFSLKGTGALSKQERLLGGLDSLNTDFSHFTGGWYDCLHTTLVTIDGDTSQDDIVEQVGCERRKLGNITAIGEKNQVLQFDMIRLDPCSFHDFGGPGQKPCPNDALGSDTPVDTPVDGFVLVKHSFKGIGSFSDADRIEFFSDHRYLKNQNGEWKAKLSSAKVENTDTMVCRKFSDGIVCDWRINEYRTKTEHLEEGCKKDGECKEALTKKMCEDADGEWTDECSRSKYIKNGLVYDSFSSYYLVQELSLCNVECPSEISE